MSESQSRYSIIENLTKEKNEAMQHAKDLENKARETEVVHRRNREQRQRDQVTEDENLELFRLRNAKDIEFELSKVEQLEKAIKSIEGISNSEAAQK